MAYKLSEFSVPASHGSLEAIAMIPNGWSSVAIVTHPHPQYGGSLHNKVAFCLADEARKAGLYSLRFNFRGVGKSTGQFDEGQGEVLDLSEVIHFVMNSLKPERIYLSGISFGARTILNLISETGFDPDGLILAGLPIQYFHLTPMQIPVQAPTLFIQGEYDEFTNDHVLTQFIAQSQFHYPEKQIIPESDHLFTGKIHLFKDRIYRFMSENYR